MHDPDVGSTKAPKCSTIRVSFPNLEHGVRRTLPIIEHGVRRILPITLMVVGCLSIAACKDQGSSGFGGEARGQDQGNNQAGGGLGANKEARIPERRRGAKDLFGRHANPRSRGSAPEKSMRAVACGATARTSCRRHARAPWLTGVHGNPTPVSHTDDGDALLQVRSRSGADAWEASKANQRKCSRRVRRDAGGRSQ